MKNQIVLYKAHLPEVFGYGLVAYSDDKDEAIQLLRREYTKWNNNYNYSLGSFNESMETFGGMLSEIRPGMVGAEYDCEKVVRFYSK